MSAIFPGHEDLKLREVFDATGNPVYVTTGDGFYYQLMMGPTGNLKASLPAKTREEVKANNQIGDPLWEPLSGSRSALPSSASAG